MKNLILASKSPRRRTLLLEAGLDFEIKSMLTKESYPEKLSPHQVAEYIAEKKGEALWQSLSGEEKDESIILAADTVVVLDARILGKPTSEAEAIAILGALSGREHSVITGVHILSSERKRSFSVKTTVFFRPLSDTTIKHYVTHFKPFDKAGAYGIQEWIGLVGIEKIEGDYYNVVGLPVGAVLECLKADFPDDAARIKD